MYFWRIEKLKNEMAARPLTERETLPYLIAFLLWAWLGMCLSDPLTTVWDWIECVVTASIVIFGIIYLYRCNGGEGGSHFLQRYFAISWVVTLRSVLLFIAILTPLIIGTYFWEFLAERFDAVAVLADIGIELLILWRTAHHIGDVATRTRVVPVE